MNAQRDPDRLINAFLMEGQTDLPDQVFDAVRASIEQQRQRAVIGPWRTPIMNRLVSIGIGAAAVVVVAVVGAQLLGPGSGGVGGGPSPTASPTPEPSIADPSASAVTGIEVGTTAILIDDAGLGVRGTVTIPAPGWAGDGGILVKNDNADPPDGAGMISFAGDLYVYGDPCAWSSTRPATPSTTVDELVAALSAQVGRDATAPVDVTIGGYAGKSITLHVPDDAVFSKCDQGFFGFWGGPDEPTPYRYSQGPGAIDELWILDVGGVPVIIDTQYYAGTPVEHVEEIRAIVESTTFEAP